MFDLQLAWWELILRALLVYAALLVMVRMTGKRTVGQFSPFDLIVVLLLAQAVGGSLTAGEESIQGGIIVVATLLGLNLLMDLATTYSRKVEHVMEGREVLVGRNGKLFHDVLKSNMISQSAVEAALRKADLSLAEVETVILEADGSISVTKKK